MSADGVICGYCGDSLDDMDDFAKELHVAVCFDKGS
jgi:hypothetical protein